MDRSSAGPAEESSLSEVYPAFVSPEGRGRVYEFQFLRLKVHAWEEARRRKTEIRTPDP